MGPTDHFHCLFAGAHHPFDLQVLLTGQKHLQGFRKQAMIVHHENTNLRGHSTSLRASVGRSSAVYPSSF